MMKAMMHIDKSQVKQAEKYVGGAGVNRKFRITPAIQAGFKTIDIMCIGGRGGASSQSALNYWGSGGGGGGAIKVRYALKDMPAIYGALNGEELNYFAGAAGAHGSAGGFDAQDSNFGPWSGGGGKGAGGITGGWGNNDVYASVGGEGGGNSASPLEGGNGGYPAFGWGGLNWPRTLPENGPWTDTGGGNGHGGGGGGGGGRSGRGGYISAPSAGGYGSTGAGAQGPPTNGYDPNYYGGMGGGANLGLLTGVTEYYGSNAVGPGHIAEGVVAYILS